MGNEARSRPAGSTASQHGKRRRPAEPQWFTVSQLCQRWQLGRRTIYKFIDSKTLPAWKVGTHLYRVAVADVLLFEERNRLYSK